MLRKLTYSKETNPRSYKLASRTSNTSIARANFRFIKLTTLRWSSPHVF